MKFLFKLLFTLILLAVIAGTIFLWFFDVNKYRDTIAAELSTILNRPVQMERIELKLSLSPTIRLVNVTVDNPTGFKSKTPFAKIEAMEMTMEMVPLFQKKIKIRSIQLKKGELNIIKFKESNNYTFTTEKKKTAKSEIAAVNTSVSSNVYLKNLNIDMFKLDELSVNYYENNKKTHIFVKNGMIQQLKALSMLVEYNKIPMQFTANMDFLSLIQLNDNFVFNMQLKAYDITSKISGSIGNMKSFENVLLNIDIFTENLADSAKKIGIDLPTNVKNVSFASILKGDKEQVNIETMKLALGEDLDVQLKGNVSDLQSSPRGKILGTIFVKDGSSLTALGVRPMSISFDIDTEKDNIDIKKMVFSASRSEISSLFKVNRNNKNINVSGQVASNFFDINDFYSVSSVSETDNQSVPQSKSDNPAPKKQQGNRSVDSFLNKLNVQIDWNIKNMKLLENVEEYYGITGRTIFKNKSLIVNPMKIRTLVGDIETAMQVKDVLHQNPQISISFKGDNINLDKIKELHKYVNGSTANLSGALTTSGLDKETLLSRLSGQVEVEVTQGKIVDKWFNELPTIIGFVSKHKSFSYSKTDTESALNCAVMNAKINNGVVKIDDSIAVETSAIDMVLNGQVDLSKETLSLSLLPSLPQKPNNNILNAAQLIRIEGSFDKPTVQLDTKKAIADGIQKGIDKGIKTLVKKLDKSNATPSDSPVQSAQQSTTETVATREPLSLCATALGHKLKGKKSFDIQPITQQKQQVEVLVQPKEKQLSPQEILKRQLIQSLTSAVQ